MWVGSPLAGQPLLVAGAARSRAQNRAWTDRELPIPSRCQPICYYVVWLIFSECHQSLPTAANTEPLPADSDVSALVKFSEEVSSQSLAWCSNYPG